MQWNCETAVVWSCFPIIRSGQNHLARHSERAKKTKADRGRGGKITTGNGQAWSSPSPRGLWWTGENGRNWLWNHLWCSNDPCDYRRKQTAKVETVSWPELSPTLNRCKQYKRKQQAETQYRLRQFTWCKLSPPLNNNKYILEHWFPLWATYMRLKALYAFN